MAPGSAQKVASRQGALFSGASPAADAMNRNVNGQLSQMIVKRGEEMVRGKLPSILEGRREGSGGRKAGEDVY